MRLNNKQKKFIDSIIDEVLDIPESWSLNKGTYCSSYWKYYEIFIQKNSKTIKVTIDPHFMLFNTLEVQIEGEAVYSKFIFPLSRIFKSIIEIRFATLETETIQNENKVNKLINDTMYDSEANNDVNI